MSKRTTKKRLPPDLKAVLLASMDEIVFAWTLSVTPKRITLVKDRQGDHIVMVRKDGQYEAIKLSPSDPVPADQPRYRVAT